jgi:iron complex outermembrane receptor protein
LNASLIPRPTAIAAALACLSGLAAAQQSGNPAARDEPQVVTVTAQKRAQNLKEVPVAISVVGSEQIEKAGVKDIYDLAKVAPSLDFGDPGTGGPGGSASIRGIGTAVFTSSAESSVGVVVDGVPMGNTMGSGLFDLERVEVLRGPQGTLFGKSASAGVLNMVTKAPVLKRFEGSASVDLASGTAKDVNLRTALNAPLGETAALRVTVHSDRVTGVVHNTFSGKDSVTTDEGGRVRLLVKPGADLSLNLIAESDTNVGKNAVFFVPSVATGAALSDFAGCGVTVSLKNNQVCSDDNEYVRNQVQGFSGQLDWTLPNGLTLTSITAWRQHKQGPTSEAIDMSNSWDKIRGTDDRNQKQATQELRLASPSGSAVEWTSGLFVSDYQAIKHGTNTISPNPFLVANFGVPQTIFQPSDYDTHLKSTALFGQATFKLNAETGLISGLRYTRDRISDSETQTATVSFPRFTPPSTVKHST